MLKKIKNVLNFLKQFQIEKSLTFSNLLQICKKKTAQAKDRRKMKNEI